MEFGSDVRVVLAPNPGIMTGPGTNQYLLGERDAVLIDAAALDAENVRRLDGARAGGEIMQLLLTHIHPDHVGGAAEVRDRYGASVAVHRSRADFAFGWRPLAPDRLLDDGEELHHAAGRLRVVHTPGHESGHCCYHDPDRKWLFTGDTILGTGTVVIAPPDGNMSTYLASLRRLLELDLALILPGHGDPITRPREKIQEYLAHRLRREQQIIAGLRAGVCTIPELVARMYADIPKVLHGAAALSVRAHLEKLAAEGMVVEAADGSYRLAS